MSSEQSGLIPFCRLKKHHLVHSILTLLLSCTSGLAQDRSAQFKDFGFEIRKIASDWSSRTPDTGKPNSMMLKVTKNNSEGAVELTVRVEWNDSRNSAILKRDEAIESTQNKSEFGNQQKIDVFVNDRKLPGFELDWKIGEKVYHVQQCYLVDQDHLYTLSIHAPADQFETVQAGLAATRDAFRLIEISPARQFEKRLSQLTGECGNELNWAKTWDEAARQAVKEGKSIVVFLKLQPGFDLSDGVSTGALMDANVIELLNEYCIALRYHKGMQAAINEYSKYGIGPASFGSTILLATPAGEVYGDTFVSESNLFYDFLLRNLRIPNSVHVPSHLDQDLKRGQFLASKGKLDSALKYLDNESDADSMRLKASIHARLMQGQQALSAIEKAADADSTPALQAEIELDRVLIQLSAGKTTPVLALATLEDFKEKHPHHTRAAEAEYWLGLCQYSVDQNLERAKPTWIGLIENHPDSRWARKTAAILLSSGLKIGLAPAFQWPEPEVVLAFRAIEPQQLGVAAVEQAKSDAISYLLKTQRENGSWISPADALQIKTYSTSHFTAAVTSVCANALIPFRDDHRCAAAIARAIDYLVMARKERRTETDRPVYMDYSPWGDAYSLLFLAELLDNNIVADTRVQELADDLISTLGKSQKKGGGWNYLVSTTLKKTKPGNHSASFMTSAVTVALMRARSVGIEVPDQMIERALDCLEELKNDDSTFDYFLFHDSGSRTNTGEEGAAGRGPLCSLALF